MKLAEKKIALVFDWMTCSGGAERVNLQLHHLFPNADIYTCIYNHKKIKGFASAKINTSFLQNLPFAKSKHQLYLSLMPYAYELFDLSDYDIVISSSHSCAKGVITKPETIHISYCHNPMRYAWDNWQSYISDYKMPAIFKKIGSYMMHKIRIWDKQSADRVDHFIANSSIVQNRIKKYYRKESKVIFPAIDTAKYNNNYQKEDYYLIVSRLTASKKVDLAIKAFNKNGKKLKIAGTGIDSRYLQEMAKENIEFLGFVPDSLLPELYGKAQALIFPQLEDFGITPLESLASGTAVIAYNKGGVLDTLTEKTAVLFEQQTVECLNQAIEQFEQKKISSEECKKQAQKFDLKVFNDEIISFIESKLK